MRPNNCLLPTNLLAVPVSGWQELSPHVALRRPDLPAHLRAAAYLPRRRPAPLPRRM